MNTFYVATLVEIGRLDLEKWKIYMWLFTFGIQLEQSSTEKAGIHPTYHEPFPEVVTSPLPTPLGAEQTWFIQYFRIHPFREWPGSFAFTSDGGATTGYFTQTSSHWWHHTRLVLGIHPACMRGL